MIVNKGEKIGLFLQLIRSDGYTFEENAIVNFGIYDSSLTNLFVSGIAEYNEITQSYLETIDPTIHWTKQSTGSYLIVWTISNTTDEFSGVYTEELLIDVSINKGDSIGLTLQLVKSDGINVEEDATVNYTIYNSVATIAHVTGAAKFSEITNSYVDTLIPSESWPNQEVGPYLIVWSVSNTNDDFATTYVDQLQISKDQGGKYGIDYTNEYFKFNKPKEKPTLIITSVKCDRNKLPRLNIERIK